MLFRSSGSSRLQISILFSNHSQKIKTVKTTKETTKKIRIKTIRTIKTNKAEEYLISLGFVLPIDDESAAIMKPLNEKFLIAKGVKSDE